MSFIGIKYKSNLDTSEVASMKVYLISTVVVFGLAYISAAIF